MSYIITLFKRWENPIRRCFQELPPKENSAINVSKFIDLSLILDIQLMDSVEEFFFQQSSGGHGCQCTFKFKVQATFYKQKMVLLTISISYHFCVTFYDNVSIMNIQLICFYHLFVLKTLYYNVLKIYPKLTTSAF